MEQQEFESKLDEYANKISVAVSDGVKKVEAAFEKGKENIKTDEGAEEGVKGLRGSPKMGLIMVVAGLVWLLWQFGLFELKVFPILLIAVGLYFVLRNR